MFFLQINYFRQAEKLDLKGERARDADPGTFFKGGEEEKLPLFLNLTS